MYTLKIRNKMKAINSLVRQTIRNNLRLSATEAPKYINHIKDEVLYKRAPQYINHVKDEVIYKKVGELNRWYTRILGLDEVKLYQERVVALQEKLLNVQEKRRSISQELTEIRKKSNDLQEQIHKVKRQDDLQRFLDLMKAETEVLKKELEVSNKFNECDREEREIFTAFTNAVRDSHEKQRAQLEYTKYFGLVLSLVGSFLTFCYSTLKKQDLKRFVEEHLVMATGSSEPLLLQLQDNQQQLNRVIKYIDNDNPQVLSLINKNHMELMNALRESNESLSKNQEETVSLLNKVPSRSTSFSDVYTNALSSVPGDQKVIFYSCAVLIGIVITRAFFVS